MPGRARSSKPAPEDSKELRAEGRFGRRSRKVLAGIPVVIVSVVAMTFNLASPAEAATALKKPAKAKSQMPGVTPKATARMAAPESAPTEYLVVEGDTISAIAGRYGLSTAAVLALNGLGWSATIFPGQKLTLSSQNSPTPTETKQESVASQLTKYTIASGDTISGVAAAHGLTTDAVLRANGLSTSSVIFPGQTIVIPSGSAAVARVSATPIDESATAGESTHTITSGDTISDVAARAGVSVQALLDANGLGWSSMIYPGQVLTLPAAEAHVDVVDAVPAVSVTPIVEQAAEFAPGVVDLTDEMRRHASTIIEVGRTSGVSDEGIVIALAAAAQESGLRNLSYGDRDSLGLFQQRPSFGWGTAEQIMDPVWASQAFYGGPENPNPGTRGLLDIPGWESMSVTEAAQAVQISGYPNHYAKWEFSARGWLAVLG